MRRPGVLIHTDTPDEARAIVAAVHPDLTVTTCASYDGLETALRESAPEVIYSVRFAGTPGFPREALVGCPSVRWVSVGGSGTDHLQPWDGERLTVTNAAGVAAGMMAEYALGAMLSFSLGLRGFDRDQKARCWNSREVEPIAGKTVLIVGLGHTGQAVAARAKALGLTVLGVRANPRPTADVDEVHASADLSALWARADFIVLCLPLMESTRGLVDEAAFAAMRPGAVLIDVSRGGIVVESALLGALERGAIRGAALDVFETEPLPPENPLWARDDVIVTPHCSSVFPGWTRRSVEMFADNLVRYRRGEMLQNMVVAARGY